MHVRNRQRHFLAGKLREQVKFIMYTYKHNMYNYACNTAQHRCLIPGQVFKNCVDCPRNPATCKGRVSECTMDCLPGCECPSEQVLDVQNRRCVFVEQCPLLCQLINSYLCTFFFLMQHASLILTHAACPIPGQVFKQQGVNCPGNPATCENPFPACPFTIEPGCECRTGQVIDEENNRCVVLRQCPPRPRSLI